MTGSATAAGNITLAPTTITFLAIPHGWKQRLSITLPVAPAITDLLHCSLVKTDRRVSGYPRSLQRFFTAAFFADIAIFFTEWNRR